MKARLPYLVFGLLALLFLSYVWKTHDRLPERVATHFDGQGRPNGWMSRDTHVRFMALFGMGVPLIVMAAFHSARFAPIRFVNLPHREYWLAEERRVESLRWLGNMGAWFACVMLAFMAQVHYLVIQANLQKPPRLDSAPLFIALGFMLACVVGLIVRIFLRFPKPPPATAR